MKRRTISIILAACMALSLVGCFHQQTPKPTTEPTIVEPTTPQETEAPTESLSERFNLADRANYKAMQDVYMLSSIDAILAENNTPECGCDFCGILGDDLFVFRIFNYGGAEVMIANEQYVIYDPKTCKIVAKMEANGFVSVTNGYIVNYNTDEKKVTIYDAALKTVGEYHFDGIGSSSTFLGGVDLFPMYISDYDTDTVYRVTSQGDELFMEALPLPGYDNYAYGCSPDGTQLIASHIEPVHFKLEAYLYDVTTGENLGIYENHEADWLHDTLDLGANYVMCEYLIPNTTFYAFVAMDDEYKLQLMLWDATQTLAAGNTPAGYSPKKETEDEEDPLQIPEATMSELTELYERASRFYGIYGVHLYIAEQVPSEMGGFHMEKLLDSFEIARMMDAIDRILSAYPDNFIDQLMLGDVEEIDIFIANGVTAVEDNLLQVAGGFATTIGKHRVIVIDLTTDEAMYDKMNHELMHLVETRLNNASTYIPDFAYSEEGWLAHNPESFTYSNDYPNYMDYEPFYEYYDWFVSSYSTINKGEDMAEIYGSAMYGYFMQDDDVYIDVKERQHLNDKLDYLCEYIRAGFDTTGWAEVMPWEVFVQ